MHRLASLVLWIRDYPVCGKDVVFFSLFFFIAALEQFLGLNESLMCC